MENSIMLPSQPKVISEKGALGVYEIDALYPGFGHTLGNSLRRVILSSLSGAAITKVKIDGVNHEFSAIPGVKEDVITLLLRLKKIRVKMLTAEPQVITLKAKGIKTLTAADIEAPSQVEIANPEQEIAELTEKGAELNIEMTVERGLGFITKDNFHKERVDIGMIYLDAIFSPIKRVSYEVENMRVGDRTDFNRVRLTIETDGTVTPREALEASIRIMIGQLKAIVGFEEEKEEVKSEAAAEAEAPVEKKKEIDPEILKTRVEDANFSQRTLNALVNANIRTIGGLARKKEDDIFDIDGLGTKGVQEIKKVLHGYGISLK